MQAAREVQDTAAETRERLSAFVAEMVAGFAHVRQRENALTYVRGLVEHGGRKSLWPTLFRLGEGAARYESLQQFLADSPWEHTLLIRACAERVASLIDLVAWVIDDTGIPKDGTHSPGVKRQYSGTLGKVDSCQIAVSLHAAGGRGTVPLGFALYLPEEWVADDLRRRKAKIPAEVGFQTKPELAAALAETAAQWDIPRRPVLADAAYGDNTALRTRLDAAEFTYVLSVSPTVGVFPPKTTFRLPEKTGKRGRPAARYQADRDPASVRSLALSLPPEAWQVLPFRRAAVGAELVSRFCFVRVTAAHAVERLGEKPRTEWLVIEWPEGKEAPTDYWLSNLPEETEPAELARLCRLRWMIELDYRQLKGELGLDHYEGRSYAGFHHHCALVTCAHAFLTIERLCPKAPRPD